jgi:hypothetical protein
MGRNNSDFNRGIHSVAVNHPNKPGDVLINRFPRIKDPKEWVPQTLEVEAKENALEAERDES